MIAKTSWRDRARRCRHELSLASLNAPIRDDGESGEWQDRPVDDRPSLVETDSRRARRADIRHQALISVLDVLNERERRIFEHHLADDPITLEDLALEFGVSRGRVRQIEVRAFEKYRKRSKAVWSRWKHPQKTPAIGAP